MGSWQDRWAATLVAAGLLAIAVLLGPPSAQGRSSLVVDPKSEHLATDIVNGTIESVESVDVGPEIRSVADVRIDETLRGGLSGSVQVQVLGGSAAGREMVVSHQPHFEVGARLQLALLRAPLELQAALGRDATVYSVVGGTDGAASLDGDTLSQFSAASGYMLTGRKWPNFPVTFALNPNGLPLDSSDAIAAVVAGAQPWVDDPDSDVLLNFSGLVDRAPTNHIDNHNMVGWVDTMDPADTYLARAVWTFERNDPDTTGFDIMFNRDYGWSWGAQIGHYDIETVGRHEFGHALGLAHDAVGTVPGPTEVMYYRLGTNEVKGLGQGDLAGIAFLYPAATSGLTCDGLAVTHDMEALGLTTLWGSIGDDVILGTEGHDEIWGSAGDDTVCGRGGNDWIVGDDYWVGDGSDRIFGGDGDDHILGEIFVGLGRADHLDGGNGNDLIFGYDGDDTIEGGPGNDTLLGMHGADMMFGGDGADSMHGQAGPDTMHGGPGIDYQWGYEGDDAMFGGGGDDVMQGMQGVDHLEGGAGADTLIGGVDDDVMYGQDGADVLWGLGGNDWLDGGSGNDVGLAGDGTDTLVGGSGIDTLVGDGGSDTLHGQGDADILWGGDGADVVHAGPGDDIVQGDAGNDELRGDHGNDTIIGGAGHDWLIGGDGADVLWGFGQNDTIAGGAGDDTLMGGDGIDSCAGGLGLDASAGCETFAQ